MSEPRGFPLTVCWRKDAGYEGWEEITGAFSTGSLPAGGTEYQGLPPYFAYWQATDYARRKHGKGQLVYCTYQLLEHLGTDPAADRMRQNLLKSMSKENR